MSEAGRQFALSLAAHVRSLGLDRRGLRGWTSTLRRTKETAAQLGLPIEEWRALDEIDAGDCDGMTYEEIKTKMPAEHAARREAKLTYRYPRGESYLDVIRRLEPVIVELEREKRPVLVIAHQAVLRGLYAYLMDRPPKEVPYLPVPLHTVMRLTPTTYGCEEERLALPPALTHEKGRLAVFHSDGALQQVLDDIVACGFDGLNPIEPKAMDINEVKKKYGSRISLLGNIDLIYTLTRGTPEEVRAEVRRRIHDLAPGGGYAVASANSIPEYVPLANFNAMREATFEYGENPIKT